MTDVIKHPPKPICTRPLDVVACRDLVASDRWGEKVTSDAGGCVLWIGAKNRAGYGQVWLSMSMAKAHRVAWVAAAGVDVPAGLSIDHLCRIRACVNPDHLEPVTQGDNNARAENVSSTQCSRRTHCPAGHCLDGPDADLAASHARRGQRVCAICVLARDRERQQLIRDAAASLGLTKADYIKVHGQSRHKAHAILLDFDPNDSQIGGHAPHWAASRARDIAHRNTTEDET